MNEIGLIETCRRQKVIVSPTGGDDTRVKRQIHCFPSSRANMPSSKVLSTAMVFCLWLYNVRKGDGFECHTAKEPISFTGDATHSVTFMWDCFLLPNESLLSVMWLKDNICVAKATNGAFTPCENYMGRVEMFRIFGISVHNISRNDSGHYSVVILLNGSLHDYVPCQPTYFPVLPEQRSGFRAGTAMQSAIGEVSSLCDQQRPSKLEIGLICGFLPPAAVIGLGLILWYLRHRRRNDNQMENDSMSPEQTQMLQVPI